MEQFGLKSRQFNEGKWLQETFEDTKKEKDGTIYGLIRLASGLCPNGYSHTW